MVTHTHNTHTAGGVAACADRAVAGAWSCFDCKQAHTQKQARGDTQSHRHTDTTQSKALLAALGRTRFVAKFQADF